MRKLKRVEKILLILVAAFLICGISKAVYATEGDVSSILDIDVISTSSTSSQTTSSVQSSSITTSQSSSSNKETSLPKTGANDATMWIVIGACVLLAVFTYKKINDYNV